MVLDYNRRVVISNTNPQSMLHLGNCEAPGSASVIVFGKYGAEGGHRNALAGYNDSFILLLLIMETLMQVQML
jgi:hypothetical protein